MSPAMQREPIHSLYEEIQRWERNGAERKRRDKRGRNMGERLERKIGERDRRTEREREMGEKNSGKTKNGRQKGRSG